MQSDMRASRSPQPNSQSSLPANSRLASQSQPQPNQKLVLTPAEWVRAVLGVQTPFGHDHLPTVFE
jgi:hypothetical protein